MALPSWLKRPTATAAELEEQLHAAQGAHEEAVQAVAAAVEAFDDDPSASAEKRLLSAREAEERARLHVDRAERLLSAARKREAEAEATAKRKRAAELVPMLRHDGVMGRLRPLLAKEIESLEAVAKVRQQRRELHDELRAALREYQHIMDALGESPSLDERIGYAASHVLTVQALEARISELPHGSPLRSLLLALRPGADAYYHDERRIPEPTVEEDL